LSNKWNYFLSRVWVSSIKKLATLVSDFKFYLPAPPSVGTGAGRQGLQIYNALGAKALVQGVIGSGRRVFFISYGLRLLTFNSLFLYIQVTQKRVLINFN